MSVSVATIYVNNEKVLKIIDTGSNPQIANVKITANENTITATFVGVNGSTSGFSCVLDCAIYNTDYTYTKVNDFELVITAPVPLEAFDGYATVGNNDTINLVYNPYNITTDKKYLTINCKDKTMQEDLNITFEGGTSTAEQWDGSYEEISSGFTVTLELGTNQGSNQFTTDHQKYYSIDGGTTKVQLYGLTPPVVLENVTEIIFYDESMGTAMGIGSTISGVEYGFVHSGNGIYELKISIDKDTTMYLSTSTTSSGGGAD